MRTGAPRLAVIETVGANVAWYERPPPMMSLADSKPAEGGHAPGVGTLAKDTMRARCQTAGDDAEESEKMSA